MRRRTSCVAAGSSVAATVAVTVAVTLAGCSIGDPATVDPSGVDGLVVPTATPDPADFVQGVDNPWLPLTPGSRWRYRVVEDGEVVERITVTVTDEELVVAGVPVTVVHDVVRDAEGRLVEETHDWFAQDVDGNVWYFGEDTTSYEGRRPSTKGSWEAGVDGAQAGLVMPAVPRIGDGFEQEHAPGEAEDRARVLALDAEATVPAGEFTRLVETEDTTPLEPGLVERKYYAKGVGLVREQTVAGGTEVVELVAHTTSAPE
jgi:hypothetical protein